MSEPKCLNPNCEKNPITRGLCPVCYQSARKLVKANRTTWEALEASGKCTTVHVAKRKASVAWFLS